MNKSTVLLAAFWLAGCASQPENPADACAIFHEQEDWYAAAHEAQRRWGTPVPVQLAIINQESSFMDDARPPRYRLLGLIPLWRPSSAYGYGQATDATWERYRSKTGKDGAERDEFEDVVDFIGWYTHQSHVQLGIPKHDAYRQYLAYHEGQAGYQRRTHAGKPGLLHAARTVAATADVYRRQLTGCRAELEQALAENE